MKLFDILLFPRSFYKKITDKLFTLYLGIALVGLYYIGFALVLNNRLGLFLGRPHVFFVYNTSLALCLILLLGLVDIVFFSIPLFDIFKFFRVKERIINIKGLLIKLMKVYVVSYFLIIPAKVIGIAIGLNGRGFTGSFLDYGTVFILVNFVLIPLWQSAILTRGIDTVYNFDDRLKGIVFMVIYSWKTLLGFALSLSVEKWILLLFK